jgi:hypothetical protein
MAESSALLYPLRKRSVRQMTARALSSVQNPLRRIGLRQAGVLKDAMSPVEAAQMNERRKRTARKRMHRGMTDARGAGSVFQKL